MNIIPYNYDPNTIESGILHIGVGNFHRAHQQFYINRLLADKDQHGWGICGVCLLPSDQKIVENLRSQHLDYTLTVFGRDGNDEIYKVGSLRELLWGIEQPAAVTKKIAERSIKIVTLTITEGGYNLDKETNKFNLDDEKIKHDIENPSQPTTVFGFIAEGLRKRKENRGGGLTILSCDNLQHNGSTAKKAFLSFMEAQDKELASWVATNVTFPNSMVDRITPATTLEDIKRLDQISGFNDKAPVYCEDFCQWVIEDNFIAGRPALERVGVEFTNDVAAYENMKLSLLNASHILLSYPSFIKGYRKVDEAMQDDTICRYIRDFMDIDITPYVPAPGNTDLDQYKQTLMERFGNRSVSDQVSRLCFDGVSKFPVYIMPNLSKMIDDQKDLSRVAFLIASYRHYLKYKVDEKGLSYEIAEPWLTVDDKKCIASDEPIDFLDLSAFKSIHLKRVEPFVLLYSTFVNRIKDQGITSVLISAVH
ncbi:mannitol dehydrogenase family protein [Olivibacter sp. SDN3]|uniref:mannitol dehydrogenase family protein n=1 Tax=Olivibacter sp. SDN3 TaxID=2764720 RepID=UPI001650E5C7|nr:mannitol dehydrogenase family protein [Olivibacter sp. SDN3]QNL51777.1 mannitol dehydrogenase family protein [Olivibacter sp. SDN3]